MKSVLQIAAGILLGTGLVVMAGANLRVHDAAAPAPEASAASRAPAAAPLAVPVAATPAPSAADATTWRAQSRPPDAVSAGMLARVARRVADRAPTPACAPPPAKDAHGRAGAPPPGADRAAPPCRAGDVIESVEIDWHGSSSTP